MEHEFSHNPIKIRLVDIKTGEWKKSYVFIGLIPDSVEKELLKAQNLYNTKRKLYNSSIIKKFYGNNWQYRLGLIPQRKGGVYGGVDAEEELPDIDSFGDIMGLDGIPQMDITADDLESTSSEIAEEDNDVVDEANSNTNIDVLFQKPAKNEKIEKKGSIEFIFDQSLYPADNIIDMKYKIYIHNNIPVYRQHIWFKYKGLSYPAQYNISIFKNNINIDIESLISFYKGTRTMDSIEGIPVDTDMYRNKDFVRVIAQDPFQLLYNNFHKYGVDEYFLVDLNDIFNASHIYNKLRKDKYQLEVLYYGFINIYFPMITFSVFTDYIKNESSISDVYPELRPDKGYIRRKYDLAGQITDEAYEAQNDSSNIQKRLFSSVTNTVVSIKNYSQDIDILLVLRNIFDLLVLTPTITYCKTNLIHDNKNVMLKKSYFNELEPNEVIPINSLLIKIKTNADTNEHMKLIIFKNGNYIVRTNWREENHMDFDKITKVISAKVNPIIQMINKMGSRVKHYSIQLEEISSKNIQFKETGFVFYYDDDVTDAKFQIFKKTLSDLQKADIITAKENVSMGQEFFFKRGMYKFDPERIEKAITISNYYEYMSNGTVKHKWSTIFEHARLFQVVNVSSKLKISINGISNNTENYFFYLYLIGMLHVYERNSHNIKSVVGETVASKGKKTLKNLKIQDPLLYDFKKIYKSDVIYSKICQKPYQPLILNEKEYKHLPSEKKARAVKYWNFTKEKSAWYSCPNPKFPFIKFIVKQHPKDYCIPCCKKIAMNENVNQKKQEIHNLCMKDYAYTGKKVLLTKGSHYIATYGKDIEVGRISRLPEHTLEPLFFDTYSPGGIDPECITADGYYLFGVDQNTESVQNVGFLYCLIHALKMSLDDFLVDCAKRIKKDSSKFRTLMEGNANIYFRDSNDLSESLYMVGENTLIESPYDAVPWNNLFMSIGYYYYGVNTILFVDQQKERIDMQLPRGLKTSDEMFPPTHQNLVVLQRKHNYYPVYLLNTEVFKRTGIIESRLFLGESGLMTTIHAVVRRHFESNEYDRIKSNITLAVIKEFVKSTMNATIINYYINYNNMCYAVGVEFQKKLCYVPIYPSHYSLGAGIKLVFNPYNDKDAVGVDVLLSLFGVYNKWVSHESKREKLENINIYPLVKVERWITLKTSEQVIGFVCNNINYYCKPMSVSSALHYAKAQKQYMLYEPYKINQIIYNIKNGSGRTGVDKTLYHDIQYNSYKYHMYEIMTLQFINIFNRQRNTTLRRKLIKIVAKTNFDKNMDELRAFIESDIEDIEDISRIKNAVGRFLLKHHSKKQLVSDISSTYYNFDKVALDKMKRQPYNKVVDELHKLSKQFVTIGTVNKSTFEFPNIIMPCGSGKNDPDYCKNNRFVISKKELDDLLNVIAHDITNPTKWKWLFHSAFVNRTVNFYTFQRRPNETIVVEFIKK